MKNRKISITIALALIFSLSLISTTSLAIEADKSTAGTQLITSTIPTNMAPETEIVYDSNKNMVITKKGIDMPSLYSLESSNVENKIKISPDVHYSKEELKILKEAIKMQKSEKNSIVAKSIPDSSELPEPAPGLKVIYDGMGQPNQYYLNGEPYFPLATPANVKATTVATATATWTPPKNGKYSYGNCWIQITDAWNMGQGFITYFTGTPGCHGDDLNKLDKTTDICATKMQYDRPPRAKEIKIRKLDSNWNDTATVAYVYKYDIGALPNAVTDIRKPLMTRLTGPVGSSTFGKFNGRYYYSK